MPKHKHLVLALTTVLLASAATMKISSVFGNEKIKEIIPSLSYSTIDPTNQDVRVELNFDGEASITNNQGSPTYIFEYNGSFTFTYLDHLGRAGSVTALAENIDKEPPTALIQNTPDEQTILPSASFKIAGWDVVSYQYRLDENPWSEKQPVRQNIDVAEIKPGTHLLQVLGCDALGNCQDVELPASFQWEVFQSDEYRIRTTEMERGEKAIEVSIENQHLWAYEGKRVVFHTPITSGSRGQDTTPGVFAITQKHLNKSFTGGFFSRYWMRFNGGMGIHDATWRQEFGVEDYKWRGSHGCVNLPYDAAEWIYGWSEIGTSVIVI